jgi:uncharacterized repeat protein (TIGR03803 family)
LVSRNRIQAAQKSSHLKTFLKTLLPIIISGLIPSDLLRAQIFTNLHHFNGTNDGTAPFAGLILSGNTLYGTTQGGGASASGTIFKIQTDGTGFQALYTFSVLSGCFPCTNSDGANPRGSLVLSDNTLYGTASQGGLSGNGTVFRVNTDGTGFTNLHSFSPQSSPDTFRTNSDGFYPNAGLILSGQTLFGTADGGGSSGKGTIFKLNTNGSDFTTIYHFLAGGGFFNTDGAFPLAALTLSGNTLYGTTGAGGNENRGTVFRINLDGTGYTNLYSLSTEKGSGPNAGLILSGNTLYGEGTQGGNFGAGTIFKLNTDGTDFTKMYDFTGTNDGSLPGSTLFLSGDNLYGSAPYGGQANNGVIFKIHTNGSNFTVLHHFSQTTSGTNLDGIWPYGSVVVSGNMVYGVAARGGSSGNGTIFSIFLLPELTINVANNNAILTWPTNAVGFELQSTTNLVPPVFWTIYSSEPVVLNGQNTVTNPIAGTGKFYRLSR